MTDLPLAGAGMDETVYSADSALRSPGTLVREMGADARAGALLAIPLLVNRLQARYRRSWLGYLWLVFPLLATTAIWVSLDARRIVGVGQTELPYPLYVLAGTVLWQLFVESLNAPLQQLEGARSVLLKSRVPHEAFLFSGALEVLFNFLVRLLVLVPLLVWYDPRWSASFLLAPVGVVSLLLLGTALGLLLAPVGLLYPDVQRGLGVVTGLLFFLTPVLYPPANGLLGSANPVTPLLVTARRWLAGGDVTAAPGFAPVLAAASLGVAVAWVGYRLARPHLIVRL